MMLFFLSGWMMIDTEALWIKANEAYGTENYQEAIVHYESLLGEGVRNGKVYYNLGNAYFKAGELGPALLNYFRAERLIPGDQDLRHNIDLANEQRQDPVIEGEREGLDAALDQVFFGMSYSAFFWLTLVMICVCGITAVPITLGKRARVWGYLSVVSGCLAIGLMVVVFFQHARLTKKDSAVVMADQVNVLAGPSPREAINFTIHEGIRCQILDEQPGWFRIRLANGYNGWLPQNDVEKI